jgi:hypothetical protein
VHTLTWHAVWHTTRCGMPVPSAVNGFPRLGCVSGQCRMPAACLGCVSGRWRRPAPYAGGGMLSTTDGLHALDGVQRQRFQEQAQAAAAGDEEAQVSLLHSLPSPCLPYSLLPPPLPSLLHSLLPPPLPLDNHAEPCATCYSHQASPTIKKCFNERIS